MRKNWLVGGSAGALTLVAGLAFVTAQDAQTAAQAEDAGSYASGQPIAFPHNLHAGADSGQANMDCMFCHFSAERSVDAGLPPIQTCVGCHQFIPGANNPEEVTKLMEYWNNGESVPWVRIYKISDHAHFPHMRQPARSRLGRRQHGLVHRLSPDRGRVGRLRRLSLLGTARDDRRHPET